MGGHLQLAAFFLLFPPPRVDTRFTSAFSRACPRRGRSGGGVYDGTEICSLASSSGGDNASVCPSPNIPATPSSSPSYPIARREQQQREIGGTSSMSVRSVRAAWETRYPTTAWRCGRKSTAGAALRASVTAPTSASSGDLPPWPGATVDLRRERGKPPACSSGWRPEETGRPENRQQQSGLTRQRTVDKPTAAAASDAAAEAEAEEEATATTKS